uniref:Uncharacterized protein n=1 Tax=Rhodopseudomonas palustris (strain DX-1) TaxID=652103 RepID=E6VPR4_RHOPX
MPTLPTDQRSWDHARLVALEQQASAERMQLRLECDMLAVRRALQRALADEAQAHKRCPMKHCRRARGCRTPMLCAVVPMDPPTEPQWKIIDTLYTNLQRRRRDQALARRRDGERMRDGRKAGSGR